MAGTLNLHVYKMDSSDHSDLGITVFHPTDDSGPLRMTQLLPEPYNFFPLHNGVSQILWTTLKSQDLHGFLLQLLTFASWGKNLVKTMYFSSPSTLSVEWNGWIMNIIYVLELGV